MHNVIDYMLFALKAEETVQETLRLLRQPESEKPVLALSKTMGSLIACQVSTHESAAKKRAFWWNTRLEQIIFNKLAKPTVKNNSHEGN